jgi:hypothetical protein
MKSELAGIYIATLGFIILGLAVSLLVWRPTRDTNELVAIILILASFTGLGMLVAGSSAVLRTTGSERHPEP